MFSESHKACLPGMLLLCGAFTSPDSLGRDADLNYACNKDGVTRYVEVVAEPGFACRVKYTKPSATTFPWNALNDADYCEPRAVGLVEKLGVAGWQCDAIEEESPNQSTGDVVPIQSIEDVEPILPADDAGPIPSTVAAELVPSAEDTALKLSAEDLRSILQAQIERYGRYIESYQVVGKTCYFYPTEAQFGNLCGDAREEAAIVYTCEVDAGGWDQNLAVFLEIETEPLVTEVGRSGFRQVSSYHIEKDQLMMETEKIDPFDSSTDAQYPVKKSAILCRYSGASDWELFEQQ
ncbi:MAG: hypothetical protein OER98_12670 [Gammaproteobacteria bacterium]|nr:hypothetical protein [Gammaproteobacteria bacterium]